MGFDFFFWKLGMDNTVTVVNLWGKGEGGGSKFDLLLARYYETRNTKGGRKMFCVGVGRLFCDFVRAIRPDLCCRCFWEVPIFD